MVMDKNPQQRQSLKPGVWLKEWKDNLKKEMNTAYAQTVILIIDYSPIIIGIIIIIPLIFEAMKPTVSLAFK